MVYSMTGYGRAQASFERRDITAEIRSVNHRFFEFSARIPRGLAYLEEKLKSFAATRISRGKVDVIITIQTADGAVSDVRINHSLARSYLEALRGLGGELALTDNIQLADIARFSDIFLVTKAEEDEAEVWAQVQQLVTEAADKFMQMRGAEGERLAADIRDRLDAIEAHVVGVEAQSPRTLADYRARLYAKIADVLADRQIDEQRILTEVAVFAEKISVDEETVRLRSHLGQFREILTSGGQIGRKLDFLVQEMNREANTIGSKVQDLAITRIVVEIKSEIEKIREQIQNIE